MPLTSVFLIWACLCCVLWSPAQSRAQELIICGDDGYPPYSYIENGKPAGIYVDILNSILKNMEGYDVKIIVRPWKRALALAEQKEVFAIFPPYFRPASRPWLPHYSEPILKEDYSVVCKKDVFADSPRNNWPDDYRDLSHGINYGFAVPGLHGMKYEEARNGLVNLKKVLHGRVDCYINDSKAIVFYLQQIGADASLLQFGAKISSEYGFLATTAARDESFNKAFLKQFDLHLRRLRASGELDFIIRSHFIR
ncbi:substrate-binding periplasmic protein [Oleidesulfovibrio sp.]|uniref:substrate-binding periplasmic protein n=1 Tax=Oleidesulfovibrio sp. TaxID=2909707 RepID=UPI003A8796C1